MENFNMTSPKKAKIVRSAGKVMMIILFISILYIKAKPLQQCTTKKFYKK